MFGRLNNKNQCSSSQWVKWFYFRVYIYLWRYLVNILFWFEGFWGQPQPNFPFPWAKKLALCLDCSTAAFTTPQKVLSLWRMVTIIGDFKRPILISHSLPWCFCTPLHSRSAWRWSRWSRWREEFREDRIHRFSHISRGRQSSSEREREKTPKNYR